MGDLGRPLAAGLLPLAHGIVKPPEPMGLGRRRQTSTRTVELASRSPLPQPGNLRRACDFASPGPSWRDGCWWVVEEARIVTPRPLSRSGISLDLRRTTAFGGGWGGLGRGRHRRSSGATVQGAKRKNATTLPQDGNSHPLSRSTKLPRTGQGGADHLSRSTALGLMPACALVDQKAWRRRFTLLSSDLHVRIGRLTSVPIRARTLSHAQIQTCIPAHPYSYADSPSGLHLVVVCTVVASTGRGRPHCPC